MSYRDALKSVEKAIVNGNQSKVDAALIHLNELVKTNNAGSGPKWAMSEILATKFHTQYYKDSNALTPLEYAHTFGYTGIATSLRTFGAPETSRTAWAPGLWNRFNFTSVIPTSAKEEKTEEKEAPKA